MAIPTLNDRIQALAQELQDLILDFTIAIDTNEIITVTADCKPPIGLQINKKLRCKLAQSYYSTNVFCFPETVAGRWVGAHHRDHIKLFKEIRIPFHIEVRGHILRTRLTMSSPLMGDYMSRVIDHWERTWKPAAMGLRDGALKVDMRVRKSDGTEEIKWCNRDEILQGEDYV